jgi:adenylosuccinate synthase
MKGFAMTDVETSTAPTAPPAARTVPGSGTVTATLQRAWGARRRHESEVRDRLRRLVGSPDRAQTVTWVGDLQQGDGGKGVMADRLAATHHIVCRVQGGDNAGHTTVFVDEDGREQVLFSHLVPSGMRRPGTIGLLGNGALVNPERLERELAELESRDPSIGDRLLVSDRAHVVLPMHRLADQLSERTRSAEGAAIGTTLRGIGPANLSKINRSGLRVSDLASSEVVEQRLRQNARLFGFGAEIVTHDLAWVQQHGRVLTSRAVEARALVEIALDAGYSILVEGAQGPFIDVEMGVYPFVTTSPTAVYSVTAGLGLDLSRVDYRVGVLKAYQTMVGAGPFVSEDHGELGTRLRRVGAEQGTTTGRDRRCGWLDLVSSRWAVEVNRYSHVVLTKLDVLDDFETIGVCCGYRRRGRDGFRYSPDPAYLEECEPIFEYFPGWRTRTRGVGSYEELPEAARDFVDFVQAYLGVEVAGVTKGPRDSDILLKQSTKLRAIHQEV